MRIHLPIAFCALIFIASCSTSSHSSSNGGNRDLSGSGQYSASIVDEVDTANFFHSDTMAGQHPVSLMELDRTEDGGFVLAPGFYEADFKSYCLQPGTPSPSARDAYFQAPLIGHRRDIIATILTNSQKKPWLDQRNIQLLLWSVVSGSDFNRLSAPVQMTADELLSRKQIFELKGGMMGVVKTIASSVPNTPFSSVSNQMQKLFELGTSSYETYEQVAVLREASVITRPDFKRNQWYKREGGYYVRYFPSSYQQVKIQVYVPANVLDTAGKHLGNYLIFHPTSMMVSPVNSNAQRLGIGGAVVDIIRKVIRIESGPRPQLPRNPPPPKGPKPQQ